MNLLKVPFGINRAGQAAVVLLFSVLWLRAAVPGDEHWDPQFGVPGPGGNNYAVVSHNNRIYVSGLASGTNVNVALMLWDGAQWSAMSQFYGSSGNTAVNDLVFVGDTLYAGGSFTNVDGVTANGLAKWDGTNWSSVGFKGTVYSLAVDGTDLYVGGSFKTNLAGLGLTNIAHWDGTNWSALGNGVGNTNLSLVYCVAASNGVVYAGGYFTNADATTATNVARWNGSGWSALGSGQSSIVYSLALNGANVYAGGTGVSQWDGANWSPLGSSFNSGVQNVAVFGNLLCASGAFTSVGSLSASHFAIWTGSAWTAAGAGVSAQANKIFSTGTNVYVAGSFALAGGIEANGMSAWDGANWAAIGTARRNNGLSSQVNAIANDGTNLYVGGLFTGAGGVPASYVARFDGTNWHALGSGIGPAGGTTVVNAIAVTNNDVYVGGYFSSAGGVFTLSVAHWDGTNWNAMGTLGGMVYSLLIRPEGVYAAGTGYNGTSYGSAFFDRWDGNSWQSGAQFDTNTFVAFYLNDNVGMDALASMGSDIYVGGHFKITSCDPTLTTCTSCSNIMRFDGTYGRILGTGLSSNVVAMVVKDSNLYVSGPFTNAGGVTANGLALWDGNQWSSVGGGVVGRGTINAMTVMGTNLYVAGSFTNLGGVTVTRIAKWDGTTWSPLGSGVSATLLALATSGSDLYAGGALRTAGGKSSMFIGHWNEQTNFNIPRFVNPQWLAGGQFQTRVYGVTGSTNVVEATTDFQSWSAIATNSSGVYDFSDPGTALPNKRFYRARLGN